MQSLGLPKFSFHHHAHRLAVSIIGASVLVQLIGRYTQSLIFFNPTATLFSLEVWRPFTALLIATSPAEVIFGALIIYSLGSALEFAYGKKKFLLLSLGLPLLGFALMLPLALVVPAAFSFRFYSGASSIMTTLWIIYGLRADRIGQQLNFWGIPLEGKTFALIGLGIVLLNGIFDSFLNVLPALISGLCAYAYMYKKFPTISVWGRIESWYYSWKLKKLKSKRGMHVVSGSRDKTKDDYTIH